MALSLLQNSFLCDLFLCALCVSARNSFLFLAEPQRTQRKRRGNYDQLNILQKAQWHYQMTIIFPRYKVKWELSSILGETVWSAAPW
ncbi:MAG: hypothetical protein C4567_05060 [Deltaproteobacteria bacterium]|nr:MAG: hypothetical protein C4567_05060 [Deltaproteobacteria bacterium]